MKRMTDNKRHWYAMHLKSRTEKKVLQTLTAKGIEAYLPMQMQLRRWSDRKKLVEMPVMPGYIFVNADKTEYYSALQVEHVVRYITFKGIAATIRNQDIETLKKIMQQDQIQVELTRDDLIPGSRVEILSGPLMGIRGELIRVNGKNKVGIRIKQVQYIAMVEVPLSELAIIPTAP